MAAPTQPVSGRLRMANPQAIREAIRTMYGVSYSCLKRGDKIRGWGLLCVRNSGQGTMGGGEGGGERT